MKVASWFILLYVFFAVKRGVYSLYEDQIGKFDWRLQFIGKPVHVVFDESTDKDGQTRRVYVITNQNVLAALNWHSGEIIWRHVLEQTEVGRMNGLLLSQAGDLITLSGGGQNLMNWERHRGTLRWSTSVANEYCETSKMIEYKSGNVAVLSPCSGVLTAFDRAGGQTWTLPLRKQEGSGDVRWSDIAAGGNGQEIAVLGDSSAASQFVIQLISATGTVVRAITRSGKYDANRVALLSYPNRLVWLDDGGTLNTLLLSETTSSSSEPSKVKASGVRDPAALRLKVYANRYWSVLDGANVWIPTKPAADDQPKSEIHLDRLEGVAVGFVKYQENEVYAAAATLSARGGFSVRFYDTKSGKQMNEWDIVVPATEAISIPTDIYPFLQHQKSDRAAGGAGIFVSGSDHSFALINQPGKIVWNRQEALSSILSVELIDLPLSEAQANIEEEFSTNGTVLAMLTRRLTSQAVQLHRLLLNAVNEVFGLADLLGTSGEGLLGPLASNGGGRSSERNVVDREAARKRQRLERDYFNLHKIIVVTSAAGKVFGIDSNGGGVVWQKQFPDIVPLTQLQRPVMPLYVLRTTAHYPHPARCAVLGQHRETGHGVLITFNPITGSEFKLIHLSDTVKQSFILPIADEHEVQGVGIITEDLEMRIYPPSAAGPFSTSLQRKPFVAFLAFGTTLEGYRVIGQSGDEGPKSDESFSVFKLQRTWRVLLPFDKQGKLIVAAMKRFTEQVHSQGRVLGDRSVLYKYLNPNLVAVMAESADANGKSQLHIYLIDVVSGNVIFQTSHRRVTAPYHLVHCENWIVYAYWNEKARRNEMTVLELYEGKEQADAVKFSSFSPPKSPIVMRQSYVFPQGITALAVTDTEKGITTRHLLMSMPFGGVLELSKAFLDPRRVLNPTMEQREEGLYPYVPDLPIITEQIINYNQTITNVRGIHTAPSGLESTSLVLVYGLDLYFTRVTPSGTFDILKDDFDHWFIGCVLVGLFVSSLIAKRLAKHRDLKLAWR